MQTPSDIALLQRWHEHRDAHAFKTLTQRYGGLVYGICNRMLQNGADAEDITQECFLKLAQHPQTPARSVGPWLHSVAVRASLNRIRSEQRRRDREADFEATRPASVETTMDDLLGHVDAAISELPDGLRACLVGSFLESKPQAEIASELGITTRTVRRRTDEAIEKTREILSRRGIATTASVLTAALAGLNAEALPAGLGIALGKIAVAGSGRAATRAVAEVGRKNGGVLAMNKLVLLSAGIAVVSGSVWWGIARSTGESIKPTLNSFAAPNLATENEPSVTVVSRANSTPTGTVAVATAPAKTSAAENRLSVAELPPIANPTKYGELAGRVEDESGIPIANADVTLLVSGIVDTTPPLQLDGFPRVREPLDTRLAARQRDYANEAAYAVPDHQFSAHTDDNGAFLIPDVLYKGTGIVFARAEGFNTALARVEIMEDERVESLLVLAPAKAIHGRLLTPGGAAIEDAVISVAAVTAFARNADGAGAGAPLLPRPALVHTDNRGEFTLWLANADIAALYVESKTHGAQVIPGIPVGSDKVHLLTLEPEMATLEGQLLLSDGTPAAGYFVHLFGTARIPHYVPKVGDPDRASGRDKPGRMPEMEMAVSGSIFRVETDAMGRFQIEQLPATESYDAFLYSAEGQKLAKADVPLLTAGESTPWEFKLAEPIRVTGRVLGVPSGAGLAGTIVRARPAGELSTAAMREMVDTVAGPDGKFSIELIAGEGTYEFTAAPRQGTRATNTDPTAMPVDIRHGDVKSLTIQVPDPWSRRFRLVDAEGHGVPGATAMLAERQCHRRSALSINGPGTDSEGRLVLDDLWGDTETQVTFQKSGYLDASSTWATGKPGEELPEEHVVCFSATTAMARVLDAAGHAVAKSEIICTVWYGADRELMLQESTDEDGWLVLDQALPATAVDLEIRLSPQDVGRAQISVASFGDVPENVRQDMLSHVLGQATRAGSPHALLSGVTLHAAGDNDLGDIALAGLPEAPEL